MFLVLVVFVAIFAVTLGGFLLATRQSSTEKAALQRARQMASRADHRTERPPLLEEEDAKEKQFIAGLVNKLPIAAHIELLIEQAALRTSVATIAAASLGLAVAAFAAAWLFAPTLAVEWCAFFAGAALPYGYLRIKRRKRLAAFDKVLPDAIDLISRVIKAGNSIPAAFEIASQQAREPVRSELRVLSGQIRLGLPQKDALMQMSERIPTPDLRFLVTAVLVQRETGGNLPEILDRTTKMIRERIRVNGELRVKTAQGRITGIVLIALPIAMSLIMQVTNPQWIDTLIEDPFGIKLVYYAVISLTVGAVLIQRITRPEA